MVEKARKIQVSRGTQEWVDRLSDQEMPALATTVRRLRKLACQDDASVGQLVKVILKDPSLTSNVIRIANSVHYNVSNTKTNTISRAIIIVGFEAIRSICITVKVIEALLGDTPNARLMNLVAQSFHAAMQAKNLAKKLNTEEQEEVFIAALLYHLGEAAFWCYGGESAQIVDSKLRMPGAGKRAVVEEVLGTGFDQLSCGLAKSWRLGETLIKVLENPHQDHPSVRAVILGQAIAEAAKQGWDSVPAQKMMKRMAKYAGLPLKDLQQQVLECADKTAKMSKVWGAGKIRHLIPSTQKMKDELASGELPEVETVAANESEFIQANHELQLSILRELSTLMYAKVDVNLVFNMVLEGIHRGVGLDRALLALKSADGKVLVGKYVLGESSDQFGERFSFPLRGDNIFSYCMKNLEPVWFKHPSSGPIKHLYTSELSAVLEVKDFFCGPIMVKNRSVGMFYADYHHSQRPLDEEQFASFRHFVQQASMSLSMHGQK
ncbi:MAG: histidine kinase [Gammaproteobacteria bacterium]|nr:MAG: histidine kinase [Gammaproteobacteria bacterium]